MPSSVNPSTIASGPGRVPIDTVTAAADLFSAGSSQIVATLTDVLTQDLAKVTSVSYTANAVTGDATKALPFASSGYFVGSANVNDLFKVVYDADDTEIFNQTTGLYVSVASISVPQTGFVSSLTLTFNTPVPPSVVYKIYYGRQHTLASLPADFATDPVIRRSADRVKYPEVNRTGLAPTSVSNSQVYSAAYPDPMLAQWKAILKGNSVSAYDETRGGALGFVHLSSLPNVLDGSGNDNFKANLAGAGFLSAYEKDIRATTFATSPTSTPYTKIDSTLNVATTSTTVTLNAADYVRIGNNTSFRLGIDMLEITFSDGTRMVVVPTVFNSGSARTLDSCKTLGGAASNMPVVANAKARWIRPNFFAGGGHGKFSTEFHLAGMSVLSPGCITDQPGQEVEHIPPFFSAGTLLPTRAGANNWNIKALTWGSYTETGSSLSASGKKSVKGELRGDGSIVSLGGHIEGLHTARMATWTVTNITESYTFNPFNNSFLFVDVQTLSPLTTMTLSLDSAYTADQKDGDQLVLMVKIYSLYETARVNMNWPANFVFSGEDGVVGPGVTSYPAALNGGTVTLYTKFTGVSLAGQFYMTRTDYEVQN